MTTDDDVAYEEANRPRMRYEREPLQDGRGWVLRPVYDRGYFWVAEHRGLWVTLRRWCGTPIDASETGEKITVSILRFWWLRWRTWRARRRALPRAVARYT